MLTRIITAVAALCLFVPVLIFSETVALPILMAILSVIAVYEVFKCIGTDKCLGLLIPAFLTALSLPLLARYKAELVLPVAVLFICVTMAVSVFCYGKFDNTKIGFSLFEVFVAVGGFTSIVYVRDTENVRYLLIFVAAWVTDTFAYFAGYFFGKRKLCPKISPKKTVAGGIGGVVGCILGFLIFGIICISCFDKDYNLIVLMAISVPLSIIGMIGDLAASVIKRYFGIKDYGKIFPGHGGVMDRFDSVLPISLLYFVIIKVLDVFELTL